MLYVITPLILWAIVAVALWQETRNNPYTMLPYGFATISYGLMLFGISFVVFICNNLHLYIK